MAIARACVRLWLIEWGAADVLWDDNQKQEGSSLLKADGSHEQACGLTPIEAWATYASFLQSPACDTNCNESHHDAPRSQRWLQGQKPCWYDVPIENTTIC